MSMLLYLDTSALAKLYLMEEGSGKIKDIVENAEIVFSSVIALPEMFSALTQSRRANRLTQSEYQSIVSAFKRDWNRIYQIPVSVSVAQSAGKFAVKHSIRGMDAIHIASACLIQSESKGKISFCSADKEQCAAARKENFLVY